MSVPFILSQDISSDAADVGGLAMAAVYHRLGIIDLLAVIIDADNPDAPACADAILTYYGIEGVPIGQTATVDPSAGTYPTTIANTFPHPGVTGPVPSAADVVRPILAARTRPDVVFAGIGYCTALDSILTSTADGASPLNGSDLIAASTRRLVLAAGAYPGVGHEWNFYQEPVSAAHLCSYWPTEIIFTGYENGESIIDCPNPNALMPNGTPVKLGYTDVINTGRPAWDEIGVMVASEGTADYNLAWGFNSVDPANGNNTFVPNSAGTHAYVIKRRPDAYYQARIQAAITTDGADPDPILAAWPGSALLSIV